MAICSRCGREFDLSYARRSMGRYYGAGVYNDYYPEGNVCDYCATEQISADYYEGEEVLDLIHDYD